MLITLTSFLLAACWTGASLYSPADATAAIPPGVYRKTGSEGSDRVYPVTILPNGLTQFDGGEKTEVYGFAPLDRDRGTFVAWLQVDDESPDGENQIYALMVRQPNGSFTIYAPDCHDKGAEVAKQSGATIRSTTPATCHFSTRSSLEKALRMMPRDDAMTLVQVP